MTEYVSCKLVKNYLVSLRSICCFELFIKILCIYTCWVLANPTGGRSGGKLDPSAGMQAGAGMGRGVRDGFGGVIPASVPFLRIFLAPLHIQFFGVLNYIYR
jgi:hypothetical protein